MEDQATIEVLTGEQAEAVRKLFDAACLSYRHCDDATLFDPNSKVGSPRYYSTRTELRKGLDAVAPLLGHSISFEPADAEPSA